MNRPQLYESLQQQDVREAFRKAYDEIETAQKKLRELLPTNPLLNLVKLRSDREGLNFSDSFKPIIMEDSDFPPSTNIYFALGVYVNLLEKEITDPLF